MLQHVQRPSLGRLAMLVGGCLILGTGVAMLLTADLGSDGYSTLVNGVSIGVEMPFFVANLAVSVVSDNAPTTSSSSVSSASRKAVLAVSGSLMPCTWAMSAGFAADTAPTNAAECTMCVTLCFLIACRMRGMSSTSPSSTSTLSTMSPIRLSSR